MSEVDTNNSRKTLDDADVQQAVHSDFLSKAKSVRLKTALIIIAMILVTSTLITSTGIYYSTNEISAAVSEEQQIICGLASSSITRSAQSITTNIGYVGALMGSTYAEEGLAGLKVRMEQESKAGPDFISLAMILPDGQLISAEKDGFAYAKPDSKLSVEYKSKVNQSEATIDDLSQTASGDYVFRCFQQLEDGSVFMSTLRGDYFNNIVNDFDLDTANGTQIYLIDFKGNAIASTDPSMIFHAFDANQSNGLDSIIATSMAENSQNLTTRIYTDNQGKEHYCTTTPLDMEAQRWTVVNTIPLDATALPRISMLFVISGFVILIMGIIASIFLSRVLTRPYEQLERNQRQLADLKDRAEKASLVKSDFLSNMSHEIRTPLNAVIGMAQIAHKSADIERKDYCLTKIEESSNHLMGVINDILDMSKIEANKFELSNTSFDFREMIRKATDVIAFNVAAKNQKLSINVDDNIPKSIISDEQRLSQVIVNLLSNAVKFTPEDGLIDLTITALANDGKHVELEVKVSDNGIGISEEQQAKLFTAFNQADSSISRRFGGTGLGLTISKQIIEMMGGTIAVDSVINQGSTFRFTIIAPCGEQASEPSPSDSVDDLSAADLIGKRMLLVEDVEVNREIVIALLETTGIEIIEAVDGREGLEFFAANPDGFDIIFMDIQMPEMDGYASTQAIRALDDPHAREVPIVAMTANVFQEDIDHAIASGMTDHIGKPLVLDRIMEVLNKYL